MSENNSQEDWKEVTYSLIDSLPENSCINCYRKAKQQYDLWKQQKSSAAFDEACKYIDLAISMIDDSYDNVLLLEEYPHKYDVPKSRVYELAGELYAIKGDEKNSLYYYQKYQYHLNQKRVEKEKEKYPQDKFILYSFRRYNEYSLSDLINNEITFGSPSVMNDPFDTIVINWSRDKNLNEVCEEKTHIPLFSESFDFYRIRSFVGNEDFTDYDEIYGKILMWSHYADCHKGFCIKYELSKDYVFHQNDDNHSMRILIPIEYSKKKQLLSKKSINYIDAFETKAKVWEYENEKRLLSYNTQSNSPFMSEKLDANSRISEIVFGFNCPKTTITTIQELFKSNKEIRFFKMDIDNSTDIYTLIKKQLKSD